MRVRARVWDERSPGRLGHRCGGVAVWRCGGVAHSGQCEPRLTLEQREQTQLGVGALEAEAAPGEGDG